MSLVRFGPEPDGRDLDMGRCRRASCVTLERFGVERNREV
jgi:hypothetical protein